MKSGKYHKARLFLLPHEDNNYHPHIFRDLFLTFIIAIIIFWFGVLIGAKYFLNGTVLGANISSTVLIDLTNETRANNGEKLLSKNNLLDIAAANKARDMIAKNYFAHESPTGEKAWNFIYDAGYYFKYAGENLAIDFNNEDDLHLAWLNSPSHRDNIIDDRFNEIGISAITGDYNGLSSVYVVQMLAAPAEPRISERMNITEDLKDTQTEIDQNLTQKLSQSGEGKVLGIRNQSIKLNNIIESKPVVRENSSLVMAENLNTISNIQNNDNFKYAKWYERIIYDAGQNIKYLYIIIFIIFSICLAAALIIETRHHHYNHIVKGFIVLFVLTILLYCIDYYNLV